MQTANHLDGLTPEQLSGLLEFMSPEEQAESLRLLSRLKVRPLPQVGAQTTFYESEANLTIYGGAAGAGKTYGGLLRHGRHVGTPGYTGVIFRRTRPQITNPGGLWDTSQQVFSAWDGRPRGGSDLDWIFKVAGSKNPARVKFAQLQYEADKLQWQGSQLTKITFDEGTHFSWGQVSYLMSRNRSTCGIKPTMDITCNPDPDSWMAKFIDWWIDDEGYPIPERCGQLRWMIRVGDEPVWFASKGEAVLGALERGFSQKDAAIAPKSVTFIPGNLEDNAELMRLNPEYRAELLSLPLVERMQLLGGNWKVKAEAGVVFRSSWWKYYDPANPLPHFNKLVWAWDTAIKAKQVNDCTAGVLLGQTDTAWYVLQVVNERWLAPERERNIKEWFELFPTDELIVEDKGSGQDLIQIYRAETRLPVIPFDPGKDDKFVRANRVSPYCEARRVYLPEAAEWLAPFKLQLGQFDGSGKGHDDMVDGFVMAMLRCIEGVDLSHQPSEKREEYATEEYTLNPWGEVPEEHLTGIPSVF